MGYHPRVAQMFVRLEQRLSRYLPAIDSHNLIFPICLPLPPLAGVLMTIWLPFRKIRPRQLHASVDDCVTHLRQRRLQKRRYTMACTPFDAIPDNEHIQGTGTGRQ